MQSCALNKPRRESNVPLYAQIIESFSEAIRTGNLASGDRLPPQAELAEYLGVSLAPVKQALSELEKLGIVARRQGLGTFVRDITPVREERIQYSRIPWFHREMAERGLKPSGHVLLLSDMPASEDKQVQTELKLKPTDRVVILKRIRQADAQPLALQTAYFVASKVPGLVQRAISGADSITEILRDEYRLSIAASRQSIVADSARAEDSEHLHVVAGSPLLVIERTSYIENGDPLEFLRDRRHPSWTFSVWLRRQDE